jgi:Fic family protein
VLLAPPPPHRPPELLDDFERLLHVDSDLPALVRVGLAHAQFATLHPNLDGEGRLGRLRITGRRGRW